MSSADDRGNKGSVGALHEGRDPAEQRLAQNSEGRKSSCEKQKRSLLFLDLWILFLPFPLVPYLTPSSNLFFSQAVLQTNEILLTFLGSIIFL